MPFDPQLPYDALPELPPRADIESRLLLKACIEARVALVELKSTGAAIPNQAVFINTMPLLEAHASSEIENIVTISDVVFRFSQDEQAADPATRSVLNYRAALREGFESLSHRPLSTSTAVRVCSRLKNRDMEIRRVPGTALTNASTGEVIYTPPGGEALLRQKLANWERFIHEVTDIDLLIRMAVAHYQFEAIHLFLDGNGRTGRVLNLLLLTEQQLLGQPVLCLSRYFLRRRSDYHRLLLAVTRDDAWGEWIAFMLEAVAHTAHWTSGKIRSIQRLHAQASDFVRTRAGKIYSRELVDTLFVHPYCRIQNLVDAGIAQRQTASVYLKKLVDLGMVVELKAGREKQFLHPHLVHLLTSEGHPVLSYDSNTHGK